MTDERRLVNTLLESIPKNAPLIIPWAEENVQLPSSARSRFFNASVSPWIVEPMQRAIDRDTREIDLMKPVQSGGSVAGEVVLCYWITFWRGFLQYNWSNDKRADERWASRVEAVFRSCVPIWERLKELTYGKCEIDFGNVFFRMQGAFVESNLDSDTIPLQINEEIHDWEPGHLKKAQNRSTAVWNFKRFNISNAGTKGDQWDMEFRKGTMQPWLVKCPGCGQFHVMRTRWDERKPELGGLRYDANKARITKFEYNYNIIRPTIHYQMPCGFRVHNEDISLRRRLSLSGKYGDPTNPGAELNHRSYTYEAVIVDYIDWMMLIKDKHDALKQRAAGDPQPWIHYQQERECIPYDLELVPIMNLTSTVEGLKKNRIGLGDPKLRLAGLDRQAGKISQGEMPHWWLAIRDFKIEDGKLRSLLVYEGKVETDEQVVGILKEHTVNPWHVAADSGDDTTHVYLFCLRHGYNAIKGGKEEWYIHENGIRRIFSPERPLHAMINQPPNFPYVEVNIGAGRSVPMPDPREPLFWLYSKNGIRERLVWLRAETKYETPDDVSDDYRAHMEAEERIEKVSPTDGTRIWIWMQLKARNDLFVCEGYIAMQVDQAGMILQEQQTKTGQTK